jgi:TolB-like protein
MELLQNHAGPASDVAFKVGFGSPSYFNKCFHETYGFPPGEVKKRELSGADKNLTDLQNIKTGYGHIQVSKKNYRSLLKRFNNKTIPVVFLGTFASLIIIFITYTLIIKGINQNKKMNSPYTDKSIVVIPFKNLSGDPENQPFADGVTEDILNNLFRISELRVISRTTSEYLSGKAMTSPEIARKLNVNYILEGSVIRDGNRVRIYVQLIDARNDRHLIAERFENEMTGIFEIQSDIAKKVADELEVVITSKEIRQIEKLPTKNTEAYNYYLQGRFFLNKRTSEGFTNGIGYFEKAIDADPEYSLAWAGLSDAYFLITWYKDYPVPDGYVKAKEYALKALELDKNLAEAHAVLGGLLTWHEWNWEEARNELKLAVELNPNFSFGHSYYSELLDILGQDIEAREQINIALELDPFVPVFLVVSGIYYFKEGKFKESLAEFQKAIEFDPFNNYYRDVFDCYIRLDDDVKALDALNKWVKMDSIALAYPDFLTDIYHRTGMKGIWNWLFELELKKTEPSLLRLAAISLKIGKKKEALDWLEKAVEEKSISLPNIMNNPDFDTIQNELKFQDVINKMGLSDYQKRL